MKFGKLEAIYFCARDLNWVTALMRVVKLELSYLLLRLATGRVAKPPAMPYCRQYHYNGEDHG